MSWNLVIFGFGFLLGGCSVMLVLGLTFLCRHWTAFSEKEKVELKSREEAASLETLPRLTLLSGGQEQTSRKKAFSRWGPAA